MFPPEQLTRPAITTSSPLPPTSTRIHLSRADVSEVEERYVLDALRSGWVAPLGPHVDAFESEIAERVGVAHALALCSGTAALHLALLGVGAAPGTVVLCPTLTFVASANAVVYTGARPVFVDAETRDGNVDASLMLQAADELLRTGTTVAAALVVDLFGRCPDYETLEQGLRGRGIPLVEDAAESLGTRVGSRAAGSFGTAAALSFNGNKVMTTSGGGMLLSNDRALVDRARYLATQARQPVAWYEHADVGYNYRLSNVLAALGRGQLTRLDQMIGRRRAIRQRYAEALGGLPGVRLLGGPTEPDQQDNSWLTSIELHPRDARMRPDELLAKLAAEDIEARHLWKPMHLQPVFAGCRSFLTGRADALYRCGVTLPSGSSISDVELDRVISSLTMALAA